MNLHRLVWWSVTSVASVAVFAGLAAYRPPDAGHVMGVANPAGGQVRRGAVFPYGLHRCSVRVSCRVRLETATDLTVTAEGPGAPPFEIAGGGAPWLDLGMHRWPVFNGNTIAGVQPDDKLGFYVIFKPGAAAPAPPPFPTTCRIVLTDTRQRRVLTVPVTFGATRPGRPASSVVAHGGRHQRQ